MSISVSSLPVPGGPRRVITGMRWKKALRISSVSSVQTSMLSASPSNGVNE